MIPYLSLLGFVTIVAYLGRREGSRFVRQLSLFSLGAALVLFAGLRDWRVGTDTGTYVRHFDLSGDLSFFSDREDVGYYFLSWFARQISDSYAVLLVLIALIVVLCYMATIVRVVRRYETAVYLFVALSVYTFFFNGARQGIAAAVCFAAVPYLLERRVWPYIGLVLFAATFHRSALIALPLYWLAASEVRWSRVLWLVLATVLGVTFLKVFVGLAAEFLSEKYAQYGEVGEGGGQVWVSFFVAQGALLYLLKNHVADLEGRYARLLNVYLIGLVPALASTLSSVDPSGLLRLHLYFSPVSILLWPMVFQKIRDPSGRILFSACFFILTIAFFVMTTSTFSKLAPYRLNSSIFP